MNDQRVGANSGVFLNNAWYVAAISGTVGRELTPVKLLGTALVLYRTAAGEPVALEDACPHRKLPLSMGRLTDDRVECGYHGLTFDARGQCVAAPTQEQIPSSAVVRSFPTKDKYGLLWIWMGDAELADDDAILTIENYDNPAWHTTDGDSLTVHCNYLYLTDNLLDPSHVAWVHRSSFAGEGTADAPLTIEENEHGLVVSRWLYESEPPPFYKPLLKFDGDCDRLQHYEVRFPSIAINKGIYCPAGRGGPGWVPGSDSYEMVSYNFLTPVDANTTRYFWLQHRNTDIDDDALTKEIAAGAKRAFEEDKVILEAVHQGIAAETTRHINLGLDAAAIRFRQLLEGRIANEANG